MTARITCPLCEWHYDVPPLDPRVTDPMALASVFGPGIMAQHAFNTQAQNTERELEQHFAKHTTVEWVSKVSSLERELSMLRETFF